MYLTTAEPFACFELPPVSELDCWKKKWGFKLSHNGQTKKISHFLIHSQNLAFRNGSDLVSLLVFCLPSRAQKMPSRGPCTLETWTPRSPKNWSSPCSASSARSRDARSSTRWEPTARTESLIEPELSNGVVRTPVTFHRRLILFSFARGPGEKHRLCCWPVGMMLDASRYFLPWPFSRCESIFNRLCATLKHSHVL
jgi:hypothetical protein